MKIKAEGGLGMRIGLLVVYVSSAWGGRYAVAQDVTRHAVPSAACIEFNQTAMNQIAVGRLKDADSTLSAALADRASGSEQSCAWLTLHNLAFVMALSGRLAEAEVLEKRSLRILEKGYPPDRPVSVASASVAVADSIRTAKDRKGPGNVSKIAVDSHRAAGGSRHGSWFGGGATVCRRPVQRIRGRVSQSAGRVGGIGTWRNYGRGGGPRWFSDTLHRRRAISRSRPDTGPCSRHRHLRQGCSSDGPDQTLQGTSRAACPAG